MQIDRARAATAAREHRVGRAGRTFGGPPPWPDQLIVESQREANRVTNSLHGELDIATCRSLDQRLRDAESAAKITVDLTRLEFMDSTGLRTLLSAQKRASTNGHQLTLRRGPDAVHRIFEITGTERRFTFEP